MNYLDQKPLCPQFAALAGGLKLSECLIDIHPRCAVCWRTAELMNPFKHMLNNKNYRLCLRRSTASFALLCIGLLTSAHAQSTCLPIADEDLQPIQSLIAADPRSALKAVQAKLTDLQSAVQPDPRRLAMLYSLEAQSYGMLELDSDAIAE